MNKPQTQFADTPNVRIQYTEHGNPSGQPVILLHGFPDAPVAWDGVLAHLDTRALRILVPALRGFGETQVKQPELIAGQEAALGLDLLAFADALGLARFNLAGHDWGARTSYAAAILAPERVASLLTLATPYLMYGGKDYPPAQVRGNWYQWYFQLAPGKKAMEEDAEAFCHELWTSWSPDWSFSKSDFAEAAKAWKNPQFAATVLHYYRTRWGGALGMRAYEDAQAKLNAKPKPKLTVPTVYVHGTADACDLPDCADGQESYFTGGYEIVKVKGAGHFPHREEPKLVARLLEKHVATQLQHER